MEQTILPFPLPNDRFYVDTDERDPDALQVFSEAGGVFLTELLEMEDRREFGWQLMFTDVRALVEQSLLAHSDKRRVRSRDGWQIYVRREAQIDARQS